MTVKTVVTSREAKEPPALPVLPGVACVPAAAAPSAGAPERLDAHAYVNELVRALHYLHTAEQ